MAEPTTDLRQQLLAAARHLITTEGYYRMSMRKLASEVGVTATSIYLHFKNKDALLHALIDEGFDQLYAELRAVAEQHADPLLRLEALCRAYIAFGLTRPETYEVMFQLHPSHMARYPARNFRRSRRGLDLVREALVDGQGRHGWTISNSHTEAGAVWATLHGLVSLINARRIDIRISTDGLVETAIRRLLDAYRTEPQPAS